MRSKQLSVGLSFASEARSQPMAWLRQSIGQRPMVLLHGFAKAILLVEEPWFDFVNCFVIKAIKR